MDYVEELRRVVSEVTTAHNEQLEAFVINFFSSEAIALAKIHLYVLEEEEIPSSNVSTDFDLDNQYVITTTTEYRLRLKTEEELLKDRADEIIRRNTPIGKCIVCKLYIFEVQGGKETIHGWYHNDCLEGR